MSGAAYGKDSMVTDQPQAKEEGKAPPSQSMPVHKKRRRHWWETAAVAIVLIIAIVGGYYGLYVTKRFDQLSNYYSRNLASAATSAQQAIDGIFLNIQNSKFEQLKLKMIPGLKIPDQENWVEQVVEDDKSATEEQKSDLAPLTDDDDQSDREEQGVDKASSKLCRPKSKIETAALWQEGSAILRFKNGCNPAWIKLSTLLTPALQMSDFDSVILARDDGEVLFSVGAEWLNIIRLPVGSKNAPVEEAGSEKVADKPRPHNRYTTVTDFSVAGTNYKLFAQPVRLPVDLRWEVREQLHGEKNAEIQEDGDKSTSSGNQNSVEDAWILVGLKKSGDFRIEAMAISPTVLLVAFGLAVIALLSLPYLKLRLLGRREALHTHDMLVLTSSLLIATTITTFTFLEIYARSKLEPELDARLARLSAEISTAFQQEVACLRDQLERLTEMPAGREKEFTTDLLDAHQNSLRLNAYPFLEMAYWFTEDGMQSYKWTVNATNTALISLVTRDYFVHARDMAFEKANEIPCVIAERLKLPGSNVNGQTQPGYYIESIRSRTTGAVSAVLSQRLKGKIGPGNEPIVVAAALAPLLSVTEPTLPPGFEFAVIDEDGAVMFHSDPARNLRENFFDELNEFHQVRAAVWARATNPVEVPRGDDSKSREDASASEPMDVDYRARTYRMNLVRLDGTSWTLVTLYDVATYRIARAEVLTFSLAISLIYTVFLIIVFTILHLVSSMLYSTEGTVFDWLWPSPKKDSAYFGMLVFAIAMAVVWIVILVFAAAWLEVILSGALGLITLTVFFLTFRRAVYNPKKQGILARVGNEMKTGFSTLLGKPKTKKQREETAQQLASNSEYRLYASTLIAVIVVISILPPVTFYRAANDEIMELVTMGDQLRWADEFHKRSDRKAKRFRSVSIDEESLGLIEEHLFPSSSDLGTPWDTHTAAWTVMEGEPSASTRDDRLQQPLVQFLGPRLMSIVRQSWEIRSLASDKHHDWYKYGSKIGFVDETYTAKPGLGKDGKDARLPKPGGLNGLYLSSPWPGLTWPAGLDWPGWLWVLLFIAGGGVAIWAVVSSILRMVFLAGLKPPHFLPYKKWEDLEGCQRALVLRCSLQNEPQADGVSVFRIGATEHLDLEESRTLESCRDSGMSAVVIVDQFHSGLWDPEVADKKLELLERLVALDCRVIIHSDVNPLHYFTMVAGDHFRGATPVLPDLGRWAAVLDKFTRCREVLDKYHEQEALHKRLIEIRKKVLGLTELDDDMHVAMGRLAQECWPSEHLENIAILLASRSELGDLMVYAEEEYLTNQVLDLAEAHYRMLWSISGKDERLILFRLASRGFASWRGRDLVSCLLRRGLIYLDPAPRLMNESFRQFVLGAELPEVFELWTEEEGASPWARLRTPIIIAVIGIFLFLFATQPQLFSQSLAFTTGIAAVIPTIIKLVSLIAGARSGSAT